MISCFLFRSGMTLRRRVAGNWFFSCCRWLDPADQNDRLVLESNFVSMRGFFPHLMAGCDCQHFLQAIMDISSAWARHTRTPRGGDARVSLADFQPSATWASPLVLLSRPAQTTAAAQRLETLNETSAQSREFSERAAAMRAPFALSLGGEEPTRTSTTPNQFPAPTNESLVVAAPALSALVANAGD